MKMILNFVVAAMLATIAGWAQQPVRLVDRTATGIVLGAPGKPFNSDLTAITTGGTAITTATTKVKLIFCRNNTGGDVTFQVTNAAGSVYVPTQNITSNGVTLISLGDIGLTMAGVTITAGSNSAIACQVEGAQ